MHRAAGVAAHEQRGLRLARSLELGLEQRVGHGRLREEVAAGRAAARGVELLDLDSRDALEQPARRVGGLDHVALRARHVQQHARRQRREAQLREARVREQEGGEVAHAAREWRRRFAEQQSVLEQLRAAAASDADDRRRAGEGLDVAARAGARRFRQPGVLV